MKKYITILFLGLLCFTSYGQNEKIVVEGALILENSEDPTPTPGTVRWTGSDFEGWDGNQWISLSVNRTVSDTDGNTYRVIKIGNQFWMAENLRASKYANGDGITDGTGLGDISGNPSPKFWFAYNDNLDNIVRYGRLYTWFAATDNRNICPEGWHLPSDSDYNTMISFLGGSTLAGGKMKVEGTGRWSNDLGDNTSHFSGLPGGRRLQTGPFAAEGVLGMWWTSSESGANGGSLELLGSMETANILNVLSKKEGNSVRCIMN